METPNFDHNELDAVEAKAREVYGDEVVDAQLQAAENEIAGYIGTGDLPPDYDPDTDPFVVRTRVVARRIVLATIAGVGGALTIGAAVHYGRKHLRDSDKS